MSRRERLPDDMTCIRCLERREARVLDRLLWCEECQERAKQRASWGGWLAGGLLAVGLALYIWIVVQPAADLIPAAWIASVVAAFYLAGRVSREIFYGAMRVRNRRAVEARPPPPGAAPTGTD